MQDFFERVTQKLHENNMSRRDLAELSGISLYSIHGIFKNKNVPKAYIVCKIARALNTSAEYLITGNHEVELLTRDPVLDEIIQFLKSLDEHQKREVYGALKMVLYMQLSRIDGKVYV
jgi:transcriptional regulator with XRE-family HTH domain